LRKREKPNATVIDVKRRIAKGQGKLSTVCWTDGGSLDHSQCNVSKSVSWYIQKKKCILLHFYASLNITPIMDCIFVLYLNDISWNVIWNQYYPLNIVAYLWPVPHCCMLGQDCVQK
jgi:hypothetical protein